MIFPFPRALKLTTSHKLRSMLVLAALTAIASFATCAIASAATTTVHVQNSRGFAVPSANITFANGAVDQTNVYGNWIGNPGASFSASHSGSWPGANAGVSGRANGGKVTVTLTSLSDVFTGYTPSAPGIDATELAMVASINAERAKVGGQPLETSTTLSSAADMYAAYLNSINYQGAGDPHGQVADSTTRAIDAGRASDTFVGENWGRVQGMSPDAMLASWMASPSHRAAILSLSYVSIGIASVGNQWIVDFGSAICAAPSCGGAVKIVDEANGKQRPRLSVTGKKSVKRGKKFVTSVRLASGSGVVRAKLKVGSRSVRVTTRRVGSVYRFTAKPPASGRGKLTIRFNGRAGWANKTVTRIIKIR